MIHDNEIEAGTGTIAKIMRFHRDKKPPKFSKYLSMKNLGTPCIRQQWYNFRWVVKETMPGRVVKLVETGLREEDIIIQDLRDIGYEVVDRDENGKQTFLHGEGVLSHLSGARDCKVKGFVEHPDKWILTDVKTSNLKNFLKLKVGGNAAVHPEYLTQLQMYMGYSAEEFLMGCILTKCKDNDDMHIEFVPFDIEVFMLLRDRAQKIISADRPPRRMYDRSEWGSPCRFCKKQGVCYGESVPEVNCRTCINSTPTDEGEWVCLSKHNKVLSSEDQKQGCDKHLFIPELLERFEALDGSDDAITYKDKKTKVIVINAVRGYDSGICSKDLTYD